MSDQALQVAGSAQVLEARVTFSHQPFVRPLVLSTGPIASITQADAVVRVRVGEVEAEGRGCIYLSDLWAWPDPAVEHADRDAAMRAYCHDVAERLPRISDQLAHPLAIGLRLHHDAIEQSPTMQPATPPALARCVCASIFDAAVHDAVGQALGVSAFDLYAADQPLPEADAAFGGVGRTFAAIRTMFSSPPRSHSPAWWIVGKADDLEQDVRPHIKKHGYFAFKLKIMGRNADEDAQRVAEVYRAARDWGINQPRLTIDSNEANPDATSVLDFLDRLTSIDRDACAALEMIEQPTGRDIQKHAFDWSPVAARKPVMVDEGLMTLDSMKLAREQGWSGFALKTCKGHSFALVAAAWAQQHGMALSLQDLTNPGLSAVHAALFAARVPTMNGVELNSSQFTPAANTDWLDRFPDLFRVRNGMHQLPVSTTVGLGGHALP
ncbi:enolase C-terminal domain-like protein [Phycisphaerales bacterium AB-hyl4]|uniref:Enolase C-terminal domain-like protein n=1 Tax=Natronomicrosphaera hydrolytica TaxID=3242702 RepID=A0ABV4U5K0_9BACT